MERSGTLILGLGNDLISDDGFGPAVADRCRDLFGERSDVTIEAASVAGLNLLDLLTGHDRALIVDVVQTGTRRPGSLLEWPLERASAGRTLGGSHQTDLATTLALGRALGYPLPSSISLLVAEAKDLVTVREELTRDVGAAVPVAVEMARRWVETGALTGLRSGAGRVRTSGGTRTDGTPDRFRGDGMTSQDSCPDCKGKGWIELRCMIADEARVCSLCHGTGVTSTEKTCGGCKGTGRIEVRTVEQQKCLKCNGTGRYPPPESL